MKKSKKLLKLKNKPMILKISYHDFLDFFEILGKIHSEKNNIEYSEKIANVVGSLFLYYQFYYLVFAQIVDVYDKNGNHEEYINSINLLHSFVLHLELDDIRFVFSSSFTKENMNILQNYKPSFLTTLKDQIIETQQPTDFETQTQNVLKKLQI